MFCANPKIRFQAQMVWFDISWNHGAWCGPRPSNLHGWRGDVSSLLTETHERRQSWNMFTWFHMICRLECFGPFWMVNKKITKKVARHSGWFVFLSLICPCLVAWNILPFSTSLTPLQVGEAAFGISNLGLCGQGGCLPKGLVVTINFHPFCSSISTMTVAESQDIGRLDPWMLLQPCCWAQAQKFKSFNILLG